jgi:hypothetical protein
MKKTNHILIAALAGIALSWFAGSTQAQVKGGERLLQRNGSSIAATATPSDSKPMSCAKCKDVLTNVPDTTSKGAARLVANGVPAKTVVLHLCEGCATTTATVGTGRQAKYVVTHQCASCGSEMPACCGTSKGTDVATKGMDVAPLK